MNTTYFKNLVAGNLFRSKVSPALPTTYYLGLSTTEPTADGANVTEPSAASGYARVELTELSEPASGVVSNTASLSFEESSGDWGTVTHFAIFDSQTVGSGNLLIYGPLSTPRTVETATIMTVKAGYLKLSIQDPA